MLDGKEIVMGSTLNLSLTDELRAFVDGQSGDGTLYATPSEFVRDLIRKYKKQMEADCVRAGVIEGFQDAAKGRVRQFKGSVRDLVKKKRG
jgi:antitoxin ParD1/3/4